MTKKICIIGLGYIGLPTAALLANRGYKVHGVDIVRKVVDTINQGNIHILEPELDTFVRAAVESGRLKADDKPTESDVFVIAVPTPFHPKDNPAACPSPNIDYVIAATRNIAPYLREGNIVILESTSPIGTTHKVSEILAEMRPELFPGDKETSKRSDDSLSVHQLNNVSSMLNSKIFIAHCPERVLPGRIMHELVSNDRIIGGITPEATKKTADFYRTFVQGEVFETDARTAEMAKLTENSFRDVNIAFANELSILCDKFGINVWELIRLTNRHPRVKILQPGCGVGGHCIAVDPWFIVDAGKGAARLIETARRVNDYKSEWIIEKIKNAALSFENKHGRKAKIACMGLAFKPDIDDLRESPALYITHRLISEGLDTFAVEPNINKFNDFEIHDLEHAINEADIIVFLVAHKPFKEIRISGKPVMDFCGVTNQ
jgi:UDP-N-acetyl-D-mannosaminuronic acid dehydrogenase